MEAGLLNLPRKRTTKPLGVIFVTTKFSAEQKKIILAITNLFLEVSSRFLNFVIACS
jgi:hypothetical protein